MFLLDGIMGEVLFYAIKTCVGPIVYTTVAHSGWAKIYSKMLDSIVPNAVKFELDHKNMAVQASTVRFKGNSKAEAAVTASTHNPNVSSMFVDKTSVKHSLSHSGHTGSTPPNSEMQPAISLKSQQHRPTLPVEKEEDGANLEASGQSI